MTPTKQEQVPMRGAYPHTDDAYRLGREPIKVDLRVPMFGRDDPLSDGSSVDQALYCASLSAPDLTVHVRGSTWKATGHYRGERFEATGSASMSSMLCALSRAAQDIDLRVGGIRVKKGQRDYAGVDPRWTRFVQSGVGAYALVGGSWGQDGEFHVYMPADFDVLKRLSESGGVPSPWAIIPIEPLPRITITT